MNISSILEAINSNYTTINTLYANKYNFTDEPLGTTASNNTSISDGGNDMYDLSNVLNTNRTNAYSTVRLNGFGSKLATSIQYRHTKQSSTTFSYIGDGTVGDGTTPFGAGSSYFTNLYPSMFVLVATDVTGVTEFSVTGNIGVDGGGSLLTDDFTLSVGGSTYAVYRKSIYGTTDPSINHIIIIPGDGTGVTHTWDTNKQYDDDAIQNISPTSLFYLCIATKTGSSSAALTHTEAVNVATQFLSLVGDINTYSADGKIVTSSSATIIPQYNYDLSSTKILTNNSSSYKINLFSISTANAVIQNSSQAAFLINPTTINSVESIDDAELLFGNMAAIWASGTSFYYPLYIVSAIGQISVNNNSNSKIIIPYSTNDKITLNNTNEGSFLLNPSEISSSEIINSGEIKFCLTIYPTSISSSELVDAQGFEKYMFITKLFVCKNGEVYTYRKDNTGAWVNVETVIRDKLYLKCKNSIISRPRQGLYRKIIDKIQ